MVSQWEWIVRLLRGLLLVPVRLSGDAHPPHFTRYGPLAVTAALLTWFTILLLSSYLLVGTVQDEDGTSCFYDVISKTMKVYDVKLVVYTANISQYFTNIFCLIRLYRGNLVDMINRNIDLYTKAAGKYTVEPFPLGAPLKSFIIFVFLSPFVAVTIIAVLCNG